jgi:hypothetical protein
LEFGNFGLDTKQVDDFDVDSSKETAQQAIASKVL